MKEIKMNTTGIRITPYRKKEHRSFEKSFCLYDPPTHSYVETTGFYMEEEFQDPCFVTHLQDTSSLQAAFPEASIVLEQPIASKKTVPFTLNNEIVPRPVQSNCMEEIIRRDQSGTHQWFVYLSQGLGKTVLTAYLMSTFRVKTIVFCFSSKILSQWKKTLQEKTTISMKRVITIDDSKLLKGMLNDTFDPSEYDIFLCTHQMMTIFGNKNGYGNTMKGLFTKMGIGFVVYDEAHRNIGSMIKLNAYTGVERTIYLSGDFAQSNPRKEQLYHRIFYGVPVIRPDKEVRKSLMYTEVIVMEYNSEPKIADVASIYMRKRISFFNYMKYQMKKPIFYDVLSYLLEYFISMSGEYRILILVNMVSHVDALYERFSLQYEGTLCVGKYHSEMEELEKDVMVNDSRLIISTYQSFSTGVDVENIKYVISTGLCTKIDDSQASGRARPLPDGSSCVYVMMNDVGFEYARDTIGRRLAYLEENKVKQIHRLRYTP